MRPFINTIFILLGGVAVFFRFWLLGLSPFKADTMEFYKLALRNQSLVELWKNPPWMNQIPLNETLSLLMVKAGFLATPFVVRLPFAVMGILALFFVWRFARRWFGAGAALLTLLLAVFNPYQLYFSRAAYHYSGAICWSAALFCAFWAIKEHLQNGRLPSLSTWLGWFLAAALACHMHLSTWMVVSLQALLIFIFGFLAFGKRPEERRRFLVSFFTGVVLLGAVMSRWVFRAVKEVAQNSIGGGHHFGFDAKTEFARLLPAYFAGENIFAVILLFIFILLAVAALFSPAEKGGRYRSLAWICALHLTVVMGYIVAVGGGVAKIAYFSAIWPHFILLMGIGAFRGIQALASGSWRKAMYGLLAGGYLALTAWPVYAIIHLEGTPTPYYKINDWVVKNLPSGAPVLTDRWLDPWNELAVHNPGGINYTFTVPDEPFETYCQFNWRRTAEQFFEKYPDAAFLELSRGKYEDILGPWDFPRRYFAQSVSITNEAAMTLRRWKIFPEWDYAAANTNRVVIRIFYNTREDVIRHAREQGRAALVLYEPTWGYVKLWQQLKDFRDWRILEKQAVLDVYNLTASTNRVTFKIRGMALNGSKRVFIDGGGGQYHDFRHLQLEEWAVKDVALMPGLNKIVFSDSLWSVSKIPLLVDQVAVLTTDGR
ncbi:MAG: glycosyltransferase family 39 protein [Kiritimatiellae bacterium]|nr:glycosyltransferase family 39 protein [Kiritimatiellia bacterium]